MIKARNAILKQCTSTIKISTILLAALIFDGAHAETIKIPLGQQGKELGIPTPHIHMNKSEVIRQFGEPLEKIDAVGTPPISTWNYEQFTVYFESEYVIHSVVKMQPRQ